MPDVELLDLRDRRYRTKIRGRQAMSGVNRELQLGGEPCSVPERRSRFGVVRMIREVSRMEFDRVGADPARQADRFQIRANEQAGSDAGFAQLRDSPLYARCVRNYVQAAFGGDLFAPLRNQRDLIRMNCDCDRDHLIGGGQLQIEVGTHTCTQRTHVVILDVPAVFPKMRGDAVCTHRFTDQCGLQWVWLIATPRLPQRGHVVDVHIKSLVACSHIRPEYNFFTMKKLLLAIVVLGAAACHTAPPSTSAANNSPGAASSVAAVERFFGAVHAQDLQAMSQVWGTSKGAARDNMDRAELEKREVILQCYFNFDTFRVLNESPTSEVRRMVRVELQRGGRTRTPVIYTVMGPGGRWYVENLDIAAVRDFCAMAPGGPGRM